MNEELKKLIEDADSIVLGAGSGLSAAAGFEYGGKNFLENFPDMHRKYGYTDMYAAGFHPFETEEEKWGFWSRYVYLNRYKDGAKPLYLRIHELLKDKNYFVITTNVDHQFQLAGFDKNRLYYMQGDYGLFQCSIPCHQKTYDNKEQILLMLHAQDRDHKVSPALIPRCPKCGALMTMNLREDDRFVEDEGWHAAKRRYEEFLRKNKDGKILFLELGVGYSTPVWIKYPFMRMTYDNPKARYCVIDRGYVSVPKEIRKQTLLLNQDISECF